MYMSSCCHIFNCVFLQQRIDYGVMSSCLVKPALYIVQRTGPRVRLDRLDQDTEEETEEDDVGKMESVVSC